MDVEEFGDLPPALMNRLSQILSKRRMMTSQTLNLFLQPDFTTIDIYDCGKLETEDYIKMFSVIPKVRNLNLRHAGQFKDNVFDYVMERDVPITNLRLDAANLVTNEKWDEFFKHSGRRLESLKFSWLDGTMLDENIAVMVQHCPNLNRLKMAKCTRLGDESIAALSKLKKLEHLSLDFSQSIASATLVDLIAAVGANLKTLSLRNFYDADDSVLDTIHSVCRKLTKLRFCDNDVCTDAAFTNLFTDWPNPSLRQIDFSSCRSLNYEQPDGPADNPIGLASDGFLAMMRHSDSELVRLDIASCRHISREAFEDAFGVPRKLEGDSDTPSKVAKARKLKHVYAYPNLRDTNISFLTKMTTHILAGMFRCAPAMQKVTAFACFNVTDLLVPIGVALIGLPNPQESIVQEGGAIMDMEF